MSSVRFAALCDTCGKRSEEYRGAGARARGASRTALRAASKSNPRNRPCPTCGSKNVLTPKDVALGYQCNRCADQQEGAF